MFKFIKNIIYEVSGQKELDELRAEKERLVRELEKYKETSDQERAEFKRLEEKAFSEDLNEAFEASVKLARLVGVPDEKILCNDEDFDRFFFGG